MLSSSVSIYWRPERFEPLEHDCRKSVSGILDEETEGDEPLIRLVYDCAPRYPALAIVLARAAIASNPDRHLDSEVLLDIIRDARVDLDLEPWNDPAELLFDRRENRRQVKERRRPKTKRSSGFPASSPARAPHAICGSADLDTATGSA